MLERDLVMAGAVCLSVRLSVCHKPEPREYKRSTGSGSFRRRVAQGLYF